MSKILDGLPGVQEAIRTIKQQLSSAPVILFYHPIRPTIVSADTSSYGLGSVITQKSNNMVAGIQ